MRKVGVFGLIALLGIRSVYGIYKKLTRVERWDLKGRVAIVTGASKGLFFFSNCIFLIRIGLGKGIAIELGKSGCIVYIVGRSLELLVEVGKEIDTAGGTKRKFVFNN